MKRLLLAIFAVLLLGIPASAQNFVQLWSPDTASPYGTANPIPVTVTAGGGSSGATSVTFSLASGSQTLTLSHACTHLVVWSDSGAADIYVNPFGSSATTSNAHLAAGQGTAFDNLPSFTHFSINASAATGKANYVAW